MDVVLLALRILLAVLLYAFLSAILVMLWRDLRQTAASRAVSRPRGHLTVIRTECEETSAGTTFPLQTVTSIGRSSGNTIAIPDAYASAEHTLLAWREGQWWLEDRASRNGTRLNGIRIDAPTVVSAGDVIGIGRIELKLELEA